MNRHTLLILFVFVITTTLFFACGGGGDDDDDSGDDDASDDDDDAADDDVSGDVTVGNISTGECLDGAGKAEPWDPTADPTNVVEVTWQDGVLQIDDRFAYVNCGVELAVTATLESGTLTVTEIDNGMPADCVCPFNFHYEISDITANQITLVVNRAGEGGFQVAELVLPLGDANKKWFIPFVEVFMATGGTSATDPVILKYAACNLYHLEDQQFFVANRGTNYFVYGYDWFDIDNPGDFVPTCQMPVDIELGALASGSYLFGAPGYEDDWYMMTATLDIP